MQTFRGIARQDWHDLLAQNLARIDGCIDVVDGASSHFLACRQSLLPGFQSRKLRQQRRVNVDDLLAETR